MKPLLALPKFGVSCRNFRKLLRDGQSTSASADHGVTTTEEPESEDYIANTVPSTSERGRNEECSNNLLPTCSKVIGALAVVQHLCANVEGCGFSCSDYLGNVGKCMLLQAAKCFYKWYLLL